MRLTKEEKQCALLRLRQLAAMERTRLTFTPEQVVSIAAKTNAPNGALFADHTPEIREATRIFRESYIEPLIAAFSALVFEDEAETWKIYEAKRIIHEAAKDYLP